MNNRRRRWETAWMMGFGSRSGGTRMMSITRHGVESTTDEDETIGSSSNREVWSDTEGSSSSRTIVPVRRR
jgi:hypothetical protein